MGEKILIHTFRVKYRGLIDYQTFYNESVKFFRDRHCKFHETNYKDKTNEFEGKWKAENKIDAYSMAIYAVEFKAVDLAPVVKEGKTFFNGKIQITIEATLEDMYDESSPAGKKEIFNDKPKESWLHKIYKKVTARDRYEQLIEDIFVTASNYQTLVKTVFDMDTK